MTTLESLKIGESAKIIRVSGTGAIRRRLVEMGAVKGTPVEIVRIAPLGDPIEIKIRGYSLSLRKEEAQDIEVETIDTNQS